MKKLRAIAAPLVGCGLALAVAAPAHATHPNIQLEKSGPAQVWVTHQATFTFAVRNTGDAPLTDITLTDSRCTLSPPSKNGDPSPWALNPGETWNYTCSLAITDQTPDPLRNVASVTGKYKDRTVWDEDDHTIDIVRWGIDLEKSGPAVAYAGDTVTYKFEVRNSREAPIRDVVITDPKCLAAPVRTSTGADPTPSELHPGEVWTYQCQGKIPAGHKAGDPDVVNTAEVVGSVGPWPKHPRDTDSHTIKVVHPAIDIEKSGPASATAGDTVTFDLVVRNPGDQPLGGVAVTDPLCAPQLKGKGADATPATLDPGDVWTYTCAVPTAVGQTLVDNTADVKGKDPYGREVNDTDDAKTTLTQPPAQPRQPDAPRPVAPQPVAPQPVASPQPTGGVLGETEKSRPGSARLSGASGCVKGVFTARVSGSAIKRVTIYLDGKVIKRFASARGSYRVKIDARRYGVGRHRVEARVQFAPGSATKAKRLRMTFQRCRPGAVAPRFTG